ncbi:MAG TPA: hypothetical protein PLP07_10045 [Pyrinomonadaceae bacterium]|nr:hypothetical protein [Chloracidobacterium sp.]MBP9934871.1 hypothetical protein [Pyrinomonadaceae bacterium]MBK7803295.1 hypothetical protein [Chloracidobacterium sp.]MBK9438548.1 hypothetical protein [Chloracidobacterium sp.]MBK9766592.1 hypothetical protein [Chloracidobacterium sp.]
MNKPKPQNSILVLATLGVYLGLVLVGATPQVLAHAAMTRQFDVKDEIEYKDDLDTKPDPSSDDPDSDIATESSRKVTVSVQRFLSHFQSVSSEAAFLEPRTSAFDFTTLRKGLIPNYISGVLNPDVPVDQFVTITNLPRAGLDAPHISDAK